MQQCDACNNIIKDNNGSIISTRLPTRNIYLREAQVTEHTLLFPLYDTPNHC